MEENHILKNSQIIVLGLCIATATIFSTYILSHAIVKVKRISNEVISVTGSAEKRITSDSVVWRSEFTRRDIEMTLAFQKLQEDLTVVREYLKEKGIQENEVIISQIDTLVLYKKDEKGNDTNIIEGYSLRQGVEVRSGDVSKITEVSRASTELINRGIQFISYSPEYFYTQLGPLKLEMLSGAAKDAKIRAEKMASASGSQIGVIRSARMGVFQITPVNSFEVSDWGMNDTTSIEKKVTAVVKMDFAISG